MTNIFQTPEWEEFKLKTGYEKSYRVDGVLILQKRLPFGRTMLYSPMASLNQIKNIKNYSSSESSNREVLDSSRQARTIDDKLFFKIRKIATENKSIFYRLELDIPSTEDSRLKTQDLLQNFVKSFEEMQPEHTLVLDLSQTEEEILNQMKPKGRYNIKVAEKHGVVTRKTNSVEAFYILYAKMAKRQKITHRSRKYFENLVDILGKNGYCEVFIATGDKSQIENHKSQINPLSSRAERSEVERSIKQTCPESVEWISPLDDSVEMTQSEAGQNDERTVLASAIVTFYGDTAVYLFGGSSDEMRSAMAPYALHWEIIKEAKQRGFKKYDFFGIAPDDQSNHPWAGVTRFKKQFGGQEIKLLGSWDLVFRPMEYRMFKILERTRRH